MKKSNIKPLIVFIFALSIFAMAYLNSGDSLSPESLSILEPMDVLKSEPEIILPDVNIVKTIFIKLFEAL